jgi:stage III sporulation protein AH
MKRVFKKNQIMITALAIMIAVAGYLNYSGRLFGTKEKEANNDLANQELLDISLGESEELDSPEERMDETPGEAVLTSGVVAEAKLTREQVRAQNKETLMSLVDNKELTDKQKEEAVAQMLQMTKTAEMEAAVETMLLSKGFSETVVTITEKGVDVVVHKKELTDVNRAQIEDIVVSKTGVKAENIVIVPMNE